MRIGGEAPTPHTLPVGKEKQLFLIFPAGITYVDYGSTNVEVDKAEGVDNILAVKAVQPYKEDTNISVVLEGESSTLSTCAMCPLRSVSASSSTRRIPRGWPYLTRRNALTGRRKGSGGCRETYPAGSGTQGQEFRHGVRSRKHLHRRGCPAATHDTDKPYTDRLYDGFHALLYPGCQDPQKTAVQQLEQNILFTFDYPEEIPAHESRTFTVAMNKFTIPG